VGRPEMEEPFLDWAFRRRQPDGGPSDQPEPETVPDGDSLAEPPEPPELFEEARAAGADEPPSAAEGGAAVEPAASPLTEPLDTPPPREPSRLERSLVDEAMKKAGLIWVRTSASPGGRALWYVWTDGSAYVVTGGDEQPDPGLDKGEVVVVVRSKETMSRLLTLRCAASRMSGDADDWAAATAELAKGRLNLHDAADAPRRWQDQTTYAVYRLVPTTDAFIESPGAYPTESGRSTPVPTPATTAGPRPWVLHRRGGSGRPLS
jgi:hypothetical protein